MEERGYKDDLREMILDMIYEEIEGYSSKKGAKKFFESNVDKAINNSIESMMYQRSNERTYLNIIKASTYQNSINSIARNIRRQNNLKTKNELVDFASYLGIKYSKKSNYNQILKKVSSHIYMNKEQYKDKYVVYKKGDIDYILEPEKIKSEMLMNYRKKTREDMKSIAKLLDLKINDDEGAEDIRKKIINHIIKDKLTKK